MNTLGIIYRCSGPNCGRLRQPGDNSWWLLWTTLDDRTPVLCVSPWDEELAIREGALFACGENCAQRLQSQFLTNVTAARGKGAGA